MLELQCYPWEKVYSEAHTAVVTDTLQKYFTLPPINIFPTFRVVTPLWTAGTITVKLRFGFDDADALASPIGLDFWALNSLNDSDLRSVAWANGAVPPDPHGNPNSILPPRCAILVTTTGPPDLTVELYQTSLGL